MTMREPNPPDIETLFSAPLPDRVVDTHISRIFLVGDRAYKMKRAVTLPYLDFSSLAERQRAAAREVDLNRRTAPELYLGLRAVLRDARGRLSLAADGADTTRAVEWLVEMRRFDDAATLDHVLEAGGLTAPRIEAVAQAVAEFHAAAAVTPRDALVGAHQVTKMNARSFAALKAEVLPAASVSALHKETLSAIERQSARLGRRAAEGFVRRGHGDLHLRNICLLDGRPVLFDCLEFDDALAEIDTAYDIAFLLMDLLARDRGDLANRALNRYLEVSGDYEALALLPLYLSQRAAIRSHVAGINPATWLEARRYLGLARRVLRPGSAQLLAIGGRSGTGKTTLARALAPLVDAACGAVVLRSDVIRKHLFGVKPEHRLPPETYTADAGARVYTEMLELARRVISSGHPVILDAVFGQPDERDAAATLAQHLGVPFRGLWLQGGTEMLVARVAARRGDASDATAAVVHRQGQHVQPPANWLALDADYSAADLMGRAAACIGID